MTIAILSLGQLIGSDIKKFENAFHLALAAEGKDIEGRDVFWNWLKPYLPQLRRDQISIKQLCGEFNTHFDASLSVLDFTTCFNSMCEIDDASFNRVSQVNGYLTENPDIRFVMVSHTNVSHFEYIMQQLECLIPTCRTGIIDNMTTSEQSVQWLFATSMFSQHEQHQDTLRCAFTQLGIDSDEPMISFLNTIQQVDGASNFTYVQMEKTLSVEKMIDELTSLNQQQTMRLG